MVTNNAINTNIPIEETKGGTAQSTYTTGDMLYASAANTLAKLPIATTPGQYLNYNGTNVNWYNPLKELFEFDDFISPWASGSTQLISKLTWNASTPGASGISYVAGDNAHPGQIQLAQNGGACTLRLFLTTGASPAPFVLGAGYYDFTWVAKLSNLSDGTDRYLFTVGLADNDTSSTSGNPTQGIYFQYRDNLNSGNYTINCGDGTVTTANTSTAATTNWTTFRITVNAAASSVGFYINGTQVANSPITTHIPLTNIGPFIGINNNAGVNNRTVNVDLFTCYCLLNSTR